MKISGSFKEMYNSLPTVELANSILQRQDDFSDLISQIGGDIIAHRCQDIVGIRLLHKHNSIRDHEKMIEIRETIDGVPALSTIKTSGGADIPAHVPNVWTCTADGDIIPLEFTEISCVSIREDFFSNNRELFKAIAARLSGHKLEDLLGLTIISKPSLEFDASTHAAVEYSDVERDANIVIARERKDLDKSKLIETTWDFSSETMTSCTPSCYSYCVIYSPGHAIEHYSQHIYGDDSP